MQDISLHLLDIIENSVRAGSKNIQIRIIKDANANFLRIIVSDDGIGMDPITIEKAQDPFFTSKTERKKKGRAGNSPAKTECRTL